MKGKFRILRRIGLGVFLVCALMVALMPVAPVSAATEVEDVWVEFPYTAGKNSTSDSAGNIYLVHFKATNALERGVDTATVTFPDGSATMCGSADSNAAFTVGTGSSALDYDDVEWSTDYGTAVVADATWTYSRGNPTVGGYRVKATAPIDIPAGTDVWLRFDPESGELETGSTAGANFKVYVETSQDTTRVLSSTFSLGATTCVCANTRVKSGYPIPATAEAATEYIFDFRTSEGTYLAASSGTVTVKFPVGTVLPSSIAATNVSFMRNGESSYTPCPEAPTIDTDRRMITATVPFRIPTSGTTAATHYMKIAAGAGVTNPTIADSSASGGAYFCMVRTSSDRLWAKYSGDSYAITAGSPNQIIVANGEIGSPTSLYSDDATMVNMYSSQIYVTLADANGNAKAAASAVTVTLSSSSSTGAFYTDVGDELGAGAMAVATSLEVDAADPNVENDGEQIVYYKDSTAGTHTLTFSHGSYTDATWTITVCPVVSLYDSNDHLVDNYGPTTTSTASETGSSSASESNTDSGDYINDAITASMSGDTIQLGDGTYEVDSNGIAVNEAITLTSLNGADSTTIRVTVDKDAIVCTSRATISGLYIKGWRIGETQGVGASGESGIECSASGTWANPAVIQNCKIEGFYNGIESSPSKEYWEVTNNEFTNCRTGICFNSAVQTTISGNTFTNYYSGIGGTESAATYTIKNNSFNGINSSAINGIEDLAAQYGCMGIGVNVNVSTLVITRNTFTGNDYGIQLYSSSGTSTQVKYNDITGNASFGIYGANASYTVNAKYNWWGDATGPSAGTGTYASTTAVGSGDAISSGVSATNYEPWLHKSKADVIADNASYQAANIKLVAGWNTLSTPVQLIEAADAIDELISEDDMIIGYYYDGGWTQITTGYVLDPCDAVYVKMSPETTYVYFKFDAGAWTSPSKDLAAGWNLISLAYLGSEMDATDAVASVDLTAANLPGWSQLISPSMNAGQTDMYAVAATSWVESAGQETSAEKLKPGLGYWIYMQNACTLAGFEVLPIVPDFD